MRVNGEKLRLSGKKLTEEKPRGEKLRSSGEGLVFRGERRRLRGDTGYLPVERI